MLHSSEHTVAFQNESLLLLCIFTQRNHNIEESCTVLILSNRSTPKDEPPPYLHPQNLNFVESQRTNAHASDHKQQIHGLLGLDWGLEGAGRGIGWDETGLDGSGMDVWVDGIPFLAVDGRKRYFYNSEEDF